MKVSNAVVNLTQMKSIKTFADFQVWIKGIRNHSWEFEYVQLRQIDQIHQERLLENVLRLKNKENDLEIFPVFPESMMDLIASSVVFPSARTFIPIIGVKMRCKSNGSRWMRNRNNINHDIVTIDLISRKPKSFELDLMRGELESLLEDVKRDTKRQLQ
ncbi:MAG: hypothetical protein P8J32_06085 [bacterium]|nr:hypothetical protein [bacterium]